MRNSLFNRFIILEEVGEGKSAKVYKAKDIKYNRLVAIKALLKSSLNTRHRIRRVECECSIMMNLSHPNILKLHYVLEDDQYLFLITPYAQGGDLLDYMLSNNPARIHEDEMRPLFFQIVSAMLYAHSKQICHRDLKPENILLTPDKKEVWVADWGFSERFTEESQLRERCGTTLYAPPEMFLGQPYRGPETDTWSLGVVLYAMRTGKFPFGGKTNEEIAMNVVGSVLRFPADVSTRLKELITAMLAKRGSKRIRLNEVMDHPWLAPLNDPGSSLMISHRSYMQAAGAPSSSSSDGGDRQQQQGERERERTEGREDAMSAKEEDDKEAEQNQNEEKEEDQEKKEKEEKEKEKEKEENLKEEKACNKDKKDDKKKDEPTENGVMDHQPSEGEEKETKKKRDKKEKSKKGKKGDEKEEGQKGKEHRTHRSHTVTGEVRPKREKSSKSGEKHKKRDPKEDGEEATQKKREKREKKKRDKEKEEKKSRVKEDEKDKDDEKEEKKEEGEGREKKKERKTSKEGGTSKERKRKSKRREASENNKEDNEAKEDNKEEKKEEKKEKKKKEKRTKDKETK